MDNPYFILEAQNLKVVFDEKIQALKGVNFQLKKGKITALIGASGSGKSITSLCTMGLLPTNASVEGALLFEGKNILNSTQKEWKELRRNAISMIFQEPMSALNPLMKCGKQITEILQTNNHLNKDEQYQKTIEWLNKVKIPNPNQAYHKYPHQMSGGQKQRVMIAMAMINKPKLLIADEPTTALDVLVQRDIIELIKELQKEVQTTVLFITHDLGLAQMIADDIIEMKDGCIITQSLTKKTVDFKASFPTYSKKILTVEHVSVTYTQGNKLIKAVDDVNLQLYENETVGLVGGSGCGKTTLSKAILGLEKINQGKIIFQEKILSQLSARQWRNIRKDIQIIFQDPYASLNPRKKIGVAIAEPLMVHTDLSKKQIEEKVKKLLKEVNLSVEDYDKYPHEFSGGQRQRICIARAITLNPKIVICDESVAALDIMIRDQILELLNKLQQKYKMTYLFITHDISVVKKVADRIIVMKEGKIVECDNTKSVLLDPKDDYTKQLIAAVP